MAAADGYDHERAFHDFVLRLPKVELHVHLNGCVRESTLFELANERGVTLSHHLAPASSPIRNNDCDAARSHHPPYLYNVRPRSLQDCFDLFLEISRCVNDLLSLRRITREALEDMAHHHVVYVELRSTPKRLLMQHGYDTMASKEEYVRTILQVLAEFEKEEQARYHQRQQDEDERLPMTCRFLVAVDRSQSMEQAMENMDIAITLSREYRERIVGVDLGGNPTQADFGQFRPLFERARASGLRVTLHCAEIPCQDTSVENNGSTDRVFEEVQAMLDFRPDRLGHALLLPRSLQPRLESLQIPVETCPTSNVMTLELAKYADGNLLDGLQMHPGLPRWLQIGHPLAVGTDDPGVFDTSATQELWLVARAFHLSQRQLVELVIGSMDVAFCDKDTSETIKRSMKQYVDKNLSSTFRSVRGE